MMGRCIAILLDEPKTKPPRFLVCARSIALHDADKDVELGDIVRVFDERRTYKSIDCHTIYKYIREEYVDNKMGALLDEIKSGLRVKWDGPCKGYIPTYLTRLVKPHRNPLEFPLEWDHRSTYQKVLDVIREDVWMEQQRALGVLGELSLRDVRANELPIWKLLEVIAGSPLSTEWPHLTKHLQYRSVLRSSIANIIYTHTRLPRDLTKLIAEYAF